MNGLTSRTRETGASTVRPYLVSRGRTSTGGADLPLETLVRSGGSAVESVPALPRTATPECRSIVELTGERYLTVAELSATVGLPVPVVRVVLDELCEQGFVRLHPPERTVTADGRRVVPRSIMQGVLDDIAAL